MERLARRCSSMAAASLHRMASCLAQPRAEMRARAMKRAAMSTGRNEGAGLVPRLLLPLASSSAGG